VKKTVSQTFSNPLPILLEPLFVHTYDGYKAARIQSSAETKNLETALRRAGISYQTKIQKRKNRGKVSREFIVKLL